MDRRRVELRKCRSRYFRQSGLRRHRRLQVFTLRKEQLGLHGFARWPRDAADHIRSLQQTMDLRADEWSVWHVAVTGRLERQSDRFHRSDDDDRNQLRMADQVDEGERGSILLRERRARRQRLMGIYRRVAL